jgi:hypothetical protein
MLGLLERGSELRELDATLRRSHGEEQAAKFLRSGLVWCGLTEQDLASLRKNDERKVAIATLIRRRTTVPNEWIARSLHLGHVSRVSRCWSKANALTEELEKAL